MRHPDPLIMSADIARVASERPELGRDVIHALYQHLVLIDGRQPSLDELREYVDRVSSLDESTLRLRLGLGAARRRPENRTDPPRRGRPKGSGQLSMEAVRASHAALQSELKRRPTQQQLASQLDVAVRTLQDFLQANGVPWPIAE